MSGITNEAGWLEEEDRSASLVPELAKALAGAALAFWFIVAALTFFFGVAQLPVLVAFGLFYSLQASFYSYKIRSDPTYRIPSCGCGHASVDATESVLGSPQSSLLGIPNSLIGIGWYCGLALLLLTGQLAVATALAVVSLMASAYLAYVMVARVRGLCSICINTLALNGLILWQLWSALG